MYGIIEFMSSSPALITTSCIDAAGTMGDREGNRTLLFRTEATAQKCAYKECQIGLVVKIPSNASGYIQGVYFEDIA